MNIPATELFQQLFALGVLAARRSGATMNPDDVPALRAAPSPKEQQMGIMDDMKDMKTKAEGLVDKAKTAAESFKEKVPGSDRADGLLEKAKVALDKDGDGQIDVLEKAKGAATGLVDKAKGLLQKD